MLCPCVCVYVRASLCACLDRSVLALSPWGYDLDKVQYWVRERKRERERERESTHSQGYCTPNFLSRIDTSRPPPTLSPIHLTPHPAHPSHPSHPSHPASSSPISPILRIFTILPVSPISPISPISPSPLLIIVSVLRLSIRQLPYAYNRHTQVASSLRPPCFFVFGQEDARVGARWLQSVS